MNGSKELFFNNLLITGPTPGDINSDGSINAADYVVWRQRGLDSTAYNQWRAHFGQPSGGGLLSSAQSAIVPEPRCAALLALAAIAAIGTIRPLR